MDAIRKRQIAEALDENIAKGSMVLALERKYVVLDTENPLPYSQLKYRNSRGNYKWREFAISFVY